MHAHTIFLLLATRRKTVKGVVSSVCVQAPQFSGSSRLEKHHLETEVSKKRKRGGHVDTEIELPASKQCHAVEL